ncbi:MAG: hypothetical protein GY923_15380 [Aestuariibacter sp.]|nr:hypothetical protein [Aestuariibacter sp.]
MSLIERCRAKLKKEQTGEETGNPALEVIRGIYTAWPTDWKNCVKRKAEELMLEGHSAVDAETQAYLEIKAAKMRTEESNENQ